MSQEEFEILALHLVQEQSVNISAQVTAGNANTVSRLEMGCAQQSVAVAASTPSEASVDRFQRTVHSAIQNEMFLAPGASQDNCEGWPDNKTPTRPQQNQPKRSRTYRGIFLFPIGCQPIKTSWKGFIGI